VTDINAEQTAMGDVTEARVREILALAVDGFRVAIPSAEVRELCTLALSAIASRQAVLPLVWRPKENYSIAETPFGEYTVTRYEESDGIGWEAVYQDAEVIGTFPTEADARNACDALHAKRINSALAAPVRDEPTHRHVKRGTDYVLIGYGRMQAERWEIVHELPSEPIHTADMAEVVIYRSVDDGSLWVRPREEFEDGRFVALSQTSKPEGETR
jgi:hypothetical protein